MRWVWRFLKWATLLLLIGIIGLLTPVGYVETMCQGEKVASPSDPLSSETRPEIRTLLTYPEWHIVHAYDDYSKVISSGDPHHYGYLTAIADYWGSLCALTEKSATLGDIDTQTKQLVYVIGVSFTFETLAKMAYEETVGRLATLLRGSERAVLDDLSAEQAKTYAQFLQQTPWYKYDFRADAAALSDAATGTFRDWERATALGFEHSSRARYANVIASAVAATGADDLTLQMVVTGLPNTRLEEVEGVSVLTSLEQGTEIETPRYRELTGIILDWAIAGVEFIDIAGNDQIMFTAISQNETVEGALTTLRRQGYGDTRHLFLVNVTDLSETLRGLDARGLKLEHVHDY